MKRCPMSKRGDAYSVDLREKVLGAIDDNGWTQEQSAEFFGIGVATVYRWERLRRETGNVTPRPHAGGQPRKVKPEHETALRQLVDEKNDRTLAELRKELSARTGLLASQSAVWGALARLGLTLKKRR